MPLFRRGVPGPLLMILLGLLIPLGFSGSAAAQEFSGFATGEARLFPNAALHPGQDDQSASFAVQPEFYYEWEGGSSFTLVPFYRQDSADSERTHFDLREFTFLGLFEDFELRVGVRKVFWGTTEVLHLVDIINQTDLVENIDTEDKLGQPMVNLSLARDWGTLDLFLLPYFRERTFPGRGGRLRGALVVDTGRAEFESGLEEWHPDGAIRYSHTLGALDFGLHEFIGTSREPTLRLGADGAGNPVLIPVYEQIRQTGLDLSLVSGEWLWKMEALYRAGQGDEDYFAWTGGFEYTFTGIVDTAMDLGVVLEGLYDDRGRHATSAFEHDIALGLRLALNDAASTQALFGWVQDVTRSSRSFFLEASRRFGNNWVLNLEIRTFMGQDADDFLFDLRDDDLLQLEMTYYF